MLSIITINLNNLAGLKATANSIFAQSCQDFEWIVIDGGSTDGSKEYIEAHGDKIAYWVSEPDTGVYNALNKGVAHAKGQYLNFLNSGDIYHSDSVVADFEALQPKADVVYADAMMVNHHDKEPYRYVTDPDVALMKFFNPYFNLVHQSIFYSRRCFEDMRYREDMRICADREHLIRLVYQGYSFAKWPYIAADYDMTGISASPQMHERKKRELKLCFECIPPAVRCTFEECEKYRGIDIYEMAKHIIGSKRWVRQLCRGLMYPVYFLSKKVKDGE